jgi:hypothetical protein
MRTDRLVDRYDNFAKAPKNARLLGTLMSRILPQHVGRGGGDIAPRPTQFMRHTVARYRVIACLSTPQVSSST